MVVSEQTAQRLPSRALLEPPAWSKPWIHPFLNCCGFVISNELFGECQSLSPRGWEKGLKKWASQKRLLTSQTSVYKKSNIRACLNAGFPGLTYNGSDSVGLTWGSGVCILFYFIFYLFIFLKNKFYLFIYLFLAALGLHCCARAFSSCGERGYSLLQCVGFSLWWLRL